MSTTAVVWIIVAVVVVAAVAGILVARTRQRRTQASARMGLPDIGALSDATDSKVNTTGSSDAKPAHRATEH